MRQWGLAVISLGGISIISSQLQTNAFPLIATGVSLIIAGIIMFRIGKKDKK